MVKSVGLTIWVATQYWCVRGMHMLAILLMET